MNRKDLLSGKKILLVDDEPDILDLLDELLPDCLITKTTNFEEAKKLLTKNVFDLAILDIMGVNGYELLEIANEREVTAVILTAHALTVDDTVKSFKKGAAFYVPKDKMSDIALYLKDVLRAKEEGKGFWWRWVDRLGEYYDQRFGPQWREQDKEFWERINYV
jgi:DNA-binding response OmpR family regulator